MPTANKYHAWYSRAYAEERGCVFYRTVDGVEVPATAVDRHQEPPDYQDNPIYVGVVTMEGVLRSVKCGRLTDSGHMECHDGMYLLVIEVVDNYKREPMPQTPKEAPRT